MLKSVHILTHPQTNKLFIKDTDTSNKSGGTILSQDIDGQERFIACRSEYITKDGLNQLQRREDGNKCNCEGHRTLPSLYLRQKIPFTNRSCFVK